MAGVKLDGVIEKVSDGDTLRITAEGRLWKVRVLALDTEESNSNPHKPVTPWGKAATAFAQSILPVGTPVTIEFPGTGAPVIDGAINVAYLDNYERPLGFVHLAEPVDGITDFAELMIARGYSPYFVKYGRAVFAEHDARYAAAERRAQAADIGVWNQVASNMALTPAAAPRNYARLMVWWELRARLIDGFRAAQAAGAPDLYDTRVDYAALRARAEAGETATVFIELTRGETVGGLHHVFRTGSMAQPFQLFLPMEDRPAIEEVKTLIRNRYVADGEDFPRRNYAYVTGPMKMFGGRPEMVVESIDQISDLPPR